MGSSNPKGMKIIIFPKIFSKIRMNEMSELIISNIDLKGMILIVRSLAPMAANKLYMLACLKSVMRSKIMI